MTKHGLTKAELNIISNILSEYSSIDHVILFGSRAMGTHRDASDIDMVIQGKNIPAFLAARLKTRFEEETNIPYFFDVIDYNTISNEALKKHIAEHGVVMYSKHASRA